MQQESKGLIRLVSFRKTDGVLKEFMGIKVYELSYAAEIEFTNDCTWSGGNELMGWDGRFNASPGSTDPSDGATNFFMATQGQESATKGKRINISGKVNFEKTERGWN